MALKFFFLRYLLLSSISLFREKLISRKKNSKNKKKQNMVQIKLWQIEHSLAFLFFKKSFSTAI